MRVGAGHAVEEFVAYRLAGDGGAGVENFLHRRAVARGGLMGGEPFRVAAAGDVAGDVVHVLDHRGEAGERPFGGALDRGLEVVRNEAAAIGLRHFRVLLVTGGRPSTSRGFSRRPTPRRPRATKFPRRSSPHGRYGVARRKDKDGRPWP